MKLQNLKRFAKFMIVPFVLAAMPLLASNGVGNIGKLNQQNDHGFWLEENILTDLDCNWQLWIHTEQRWGNNYRKFWYHEYEGLLQYDLTNKINDWLCLDPCGFFKSFTIGPGFKEQYQIAKNRLGTFVWISQNVPIAEANLKLTWNDWLLRQRYRGEYVAYNTRHFREYGQFRYKLYLFAPWKWTCFNINPWIANEFFFRQNSRKDGATIQVGNFFENRARAGFGMTLYDKLTADLWYQWRAQKQAPGVHPHWLNTYHIGATVTLAL